jgi:putative Holliday junction resolvase
VLGVDYGHKRVGIALSDPLGMTASPLEVVPTADSVRRVAELVAEHQVSVVVVGLPNPLKGGDSESTRRARQLGSAIGESTGAEIVYVDERYTSNLAERTLIESGMRRRERRENVDKVAAAIILQTFLDGNSPDAGDVEDTGVI